VRGTLGGEGAAGLGPHQPGAGGARVPGPHVGLVPGDHRGDRPRRRRLPRTGRLTSGRTSLVTLAAGVRVRPEPFGCLAYVGDRDHFFAVDRAGARVLDAALLGAPIDPADAPAARVLGRFGVLESGEPPAFHHGVSLLGDFDAVPAVARPLVVNCFATSECPLRCRYCYADD